MLDQAATLARELVKLCDAAVPQPRRPGDHRKQDRHLHIVPGVAVLGGLAWRVLRRPAAAAALTGAAVVTTVAAPVPFAVTPGRAVHVPARVRPSLPRPGAAVPAARQQPTRVPGGPVTPPPSPSPGAAPVLAGTASARPSPSPSLSPPPTLPVTVPPLSPSPSPSGSCLPLPLPASRAPCLPA